LHKYAGSIVSWHCCKAELDFPETGIRGMARDEMRLLQGGESHCGKSGNNLGLKSVAEPVRYAILKTVAKG